MAKPTDDTPPGGLDADHAPRPLDEERGTFFELSLDLLSIVGLDGRFKQLNPAWERTLGYTLDELMAQPIVSFVHPDDQTATMAALEQVVRGNKIASFTNRYRKKDGTYVKLEWNGAGLADRQLIYGVARDLSECERLSSERLSSEARLAHLLRVSRVVLYSARPDGDLGCTYVSDTAVEQLGYEPWQFLQDPSFWADRVHPDDQQRIQAELSRLPDRGELAFEYRFRRGDGAYRWLHESCRMVRDDGGKAVEIIGAWQDVTERKEMEQTLRHQAAALLDLSTPLIPISDDIVVMPLVGVIDSRRAAQVLETVLQGVASRGARTAILDITGVGIVDTQVAETLLRAAKAVQLLGAEVVLTGIRAEVAQTLVGLGADLAGLVTCGTLQAGIRRAMQRRAAAPR